MIYDVIFSKYAQDDLESILDYTITTFGENQYWKYRELLKEAILVIQENPYVITSHERNELAEGARIYNISQLTAKASHFLLYRVDESNRRIELARILHKSMDFKSQIPPELE